MLRRLLVGSVLWNISRDADARHQKLLRLAVKSLGLHVAQELSRQFSRVDTSSEPRHHGITCKPSAQRDFESPWFVHWCRELKIAPGFDRKLWEYAYLLQCLYENGKLVDGQRGIGFGCGEEPIPSYLAARGVEVTVTDLDPGRARGRGWMETGQHTTVLEKVFRPEIVSPERFADRVRLQYVDMSDIPSTLDGRFDFCWSLCAMEHLGSIDQGLRFVERAMRTLRPGGLAVHTTEFNYGSEDRTVDGKSTVLFLRRHFVALKERLERAGHRARSLDFDVGTAVLDRFIDPPPYAWDDPLVGDRNFQGPHIKVVVGGFPTTCFGIAAERGP